MHLAVGFNIHGPGMQHLYIFGIKTPEMQKRFKDLKNAEPPYNHHFKQTIVNAALRVDDVACALFTSIGNYNHVSFAHHFFVPGMNGHAHFAVPVQRFYKCE